MKEMNFADIEVAAISIVAELERVKKERDLAIGLLEYYSDNLCPEECPFYVSDTRGGCDRAPCKHTWKEMIPVLVIEKEERKKKRKSYILTCESHDNTQKERRIYRRISDRPKEVGFVIKKPYGVRLKVLSCEEYKNANAQE